MEFELLDYKRSTANLACSILKEFNANPTHETLDIADEVLARGYDNVIVYILDGLGMKILEKNCSEASLFRSHVYGEYKSVFLPTTVAATTSMDSALYPSETAWLAWDCYYPEIDKNVTVFLNTLTETNIPVADYNVARTLRPYKSVVAKINEAGGEAYYSHPFEAPFLQTFEERADHIVELCSKPGKKYIYAYDPQPDGSMHRYGTGAKEAKQTIAQLERKVAALCERLNALDTSTLLIVTADHGQMDPTKYCILDYPDIMDCLVRDLSLEPRALNFFVKPECMDKFPALFNGHFGETFKLLTHKEVIDGELFGTGEPHEKFEGMIGDFVAVATGDAAIFFSYEAMEAHIGFHGGMTEDEMRVPLIVFECGAVK